MISRHSGFVLCTPRNDVVEAGYLNAALISAIGAISRTKVNAP
jgi:hypothetical protein